MDLCQDSQDFSDYSSILSSEKDLTYLSELSEQNILGSESSANQSMLISRSSIISENILEEVKESEVNTEYPNLVYAEFMTLITKHKITYNKEDYYLQHLFLINCIKNILSIPNLFPNFALNFKKIEVIILINYLSYKLNLIYYIFTKILNIIIKA